MKAEVYNVQIDTISKTAADCMLFADYGSLFSVLLFKSCPFAQRRI